MRLILVVSALATLLAMVGCASNSRNQAADSASNVAANPATPSPEVASGASEEASEIEVVSEADARDAEGFFRKGVEAYKKNRDAEAVAAFKEAVRLDPNFAEAHYRLGLAYNALEQKDEAKKAYEAAVKAYKKLLQSKPKDAEAHYNLGLVYGKLFKPEEAVKELKQAARLNEDDYNMHYELGLAYTKLAQYKEAVSAFNRALEISPEDYRATEALERARSGLQRREAFLKQQEKETKRGGGKPKVRTVPYYENTNQRTPPPAQ
ncbi:MAG TPA: tetratricopeptide repeat protein [Pyrinomonadaceae bacterium]|jgi:tetratricopeptide (TPR) repeat protein